MAEAERLAPEDRILQAHEYEDRTLPKYVYTECGYALSF